MYLTEMYYIKYILRITDFLTYTNIIPSEINILNVAYVIRKYNTQLVELFIHLQE